MGCATEVGALSRPTPLSDRVAYADRLAAYADEVLTGRSMVVLVEGPAGGGKSTLLTEFCMTAAPRFDGLVHYRAVPDTASHRFAAVRAMFDDGGVSGIDGTKTPVEALSGDPEATLAIVIDDAQWCDDASLRWLDALMREHTRRPIMLLLARTSTVRGPADRQLAELAAQRRCRLLAIGRAPQATGPAEQAPELTAVAGAMGVLDSADAGLVSRLTGIAQPRVRSAIGALIDDPAWCAPLRQAPGQSGVDTAALHARAARLLNDEARPVVEIAEHLVAVRRLTEPWMLDVLLCAAAELEAEPAIAVRYLASAAAAWPEDLGVRLALAGALSALDADLAMAELAATIALPVEQRTRRALVALFAQLAGSAGSTGEAIASVRDLLATMRDDSGAESRTLTLVALAMASTRRKLPWKVLRSRLGAVAPAPASTSSAQATSARSALASAMRGQRFEVAAAWARGALRNSVPPVAQSLLSAARVLHLADDLPNSLRALDAQLVDSITDGDPTTMGHALALRSLVSRDCGDPRGAVSDARVATLIARSDEREPGTVLPRVALASALYYDEEPAAAERMLRVRPDSEWDQLLQLNWLGRLRNLHGDPESALRYLAECQRRHEEYRVANPVFAPWWVESVLILSELGRIGEATEHIERAGELVRRWPTARARGLLLLAEAMVAPAAAVVERLQESCRVLATSFSLTDQARAEYLLGRTLLRLEDPAPARPHLRQAALLATSSGWRALDTLARQKLGMAGGRMRGPAIRRADSRHPATRHTSVRWAHLLTEREREVADMVRHGASNRDIAAALFVSPRTVELHLTNIYRKLSVASRAELIEAASGDRTRTAPVFATGDRLPTVDADATGWLGRRHGLAG